MASVALTTAPGHIFKSEDASEEASDVEQQIYQKYESSRVRIEQELRGELQSENATPMNALSEEMQAYMQYIYSYLSSSNKAIVQRDAIDTSSDMYQAWKNGTISLREYLYYGIANNWIDTTKLDIQSGIRMRTMSSRHCWTTVSAIWNRIRHSRN